MKAYIYLIGLAVLLVGVGAIFLIPHGSAGNATSDSASGQIKEITLSIKNYNYYPNTITVKQGETVRIKLDSSVRGCYRTLVIKDFGVAKNLPTPEDYVEFRADKKGSFGFACSMGMGTGTLIVE